MTNVCNNLILEGIDCFYEKYIQMCRSGYNGGSVGVFCRLYR